MNSLIAFDLTFTGLVETAGLTLLVSAIPIMLVALLGKLTVHMFGDPRVRYATGVSTLFLIAVIPIATALLLVKLESGFNSLASIQNETNEPNENSAANNDREISQREIEERDSKNSASNHDNARRFDMVGPGNRDKDEVPFNVRHVEPVQDESIAATNEPTFAETNQVLRGVTVTVLAWTKTHVSPWMPWVVAVWGLGFVAFFGRVWIGSRYSAYIARHGLSIDKTLQEKLNHICRKENICRRVSIFLSDLVHVPVVVGFFKSVILVPASTLTNLNSQELESILRHELAHIRRYDAVVNLLQTLLETTLFYHPAVWWVSRQVRMDRELCCDRWAAKNNGQAKTLARALLRLEESRAATPVMAATGGNLMTRIERLLESEKTTLAKKSRTGAVTLSLLTLLIACAAIGGWVTQSDQRTQQDNSVQADDSEKADKLADSGYSKLVVTVYDEENQSQQLYVDDRATIQTLLDFFPGAELGRQGMQPAGYTVNYHLVFSGPEKNDLRIGLSTRLMLWNAGKGDWKFKSLAQFRKVLNEQFDRSKAENEEVLKQLDESVKRLGNWTAFNKFRSRSYMIVAHQLLKLSPDVRANVMKSWCKQYNDQVILLCKMLFKKADGKLRRPSLGGPLFIDGRKIKDWPLEPITLVDNVPFVVVRGYIIGGGRAETAKQYLAYCLKEGTWTSRDYSHSDQQHIEAALEKLLASHPDMIEHARKILATQVQLTDDQTDLLKKQLDREIELLPDWYDNSGFKSQPYMQMANRLLMLPPDDRKELLKKWAPKHNGPTFVLCRMLFEKDGGFRRPGLGAPLFMDEGKIGQWPLEPITLVDNVPFVIVLGYRLAGRPELASKYLDYCLENCGWTDRNYSKHDLTTIANSFKKLVGRYDALPSVVRSFLANQIVIDDEQTRKRVTQLKEDIKQLPKWYTKKEFRSAPYMKVAHQLQQLSPEKRMELLNGWTKDYNEQLFILCRMLFENKDGFRRPGLGGPVFVYTSVMEDWPLEPITLVENVPFLIVDGYVLGGLPESSKSYLQYCYDKCQWSERDYSQSDQDTLNAALGKLLADKKDQLGEYSTEFLSMQVAPQHLDWQLYGKVTDDEGNPLADVELRMATGMATLLGGGSAKTDKDGNYRLNFGEGIWSNEGPNMQVAWLFVSKPGYVYKSNSRKIDLSMAMSRQRLNAEQMPKTAWSNMRPNDLIVKNSPHKMNIVMSKPAEVLVRVFDNKGNRVKNSNIGVDDTNQTSEATDVQFAEDEKPHVDLAMGLATNKQWTLSVPLEGRRRQKASPLLFKDPGRYEVEVVLLESGGAKTLEIQSVKKADGSEVSGEVIFQAGPSLRPLGEELTAKAISHVKEMAKKNKVWLKPGQQNEIKWEDLEFEIEQDGKTANVKGAVPNQLFPVFRTALHYLVEKPDEVIYRQLNENEFGEIVIAFSFKEPIRVSFGNGIQGKYHGFVQTNVHEGTLTIDGKTMTPKSLITNNSKVEFSDFIQIERGQFAPRTMKIVQPLACEWKFDVYQGGIWMLYSIDDGRLKVKKISQSGMPLEKIEK